MNRPSPVSEHCSRQLADLTTSLRRGASCLVECDKDLTLFVFADLRSRLESVGLSWVFVEGRPGPTDSDARDQWVITAMLAQVRAAVRAPVEDRLIILPHLDVLAAESGGLAPVAREIIPLLYENPEQLWLGFRDPSLPLLEVVEKRFTGRFVIRRPPGFREVFTTTATESSSALAPPSGGTEPVRE